MRPSLLSLLAIVVAMAQVAVAPCWGNDKAGAPATQTQPTTAPAQGTTTVTFYVTADLHEHTTTLPRIAGYVKAAKAKGPNVLLLDAGDLVNTGEKAMQITQGEAMVSLLAAAGYDACVLGNHDYSRGKSRLLDLCRKYPGFPLLMANVKWEAGEQEWAARIPRWKLLKLHGLTVGIIGTGSNDLRYAARSRFAVYYQPAVVHQLVPVVRKQADIVVALTHQFEQQDWETACGPDAPDLILGGHSHGAYFRTYGQGGRSYILKPGPYGRKLGRVVLTWDGTKIVQRDGSLLDVQKDWPVDEAVRALRQKYVAAAGEPAKTKAGAP
jgi:2',3'-cyclic-nucleotide 2'-phosphodiesterase (5'-nucleotidase family)